MIRQGLIGNFGLLVKKPGLFPTFQVFRSNNLEPFRNTIAETLGEEKVNINAEHMTSI